MCIQMLITLLSTSITVADQFAAAAQHNPRQADSSPVSPLSDPLLYNFIRFNAAFFGFASAHSQTHCSGLPRQSLQNQNDGLHCQYYDSAAYATFPWFFTSEMTSWTYGLACFIYSALCALGEPAFEDTGRSTSIHQNIPFVQSGLGVNLCRYREMILHTQNQFHAKR